MNCLLMRVFLTGVLILHFAWQATFAADPGPTLKQLLASTETTPGMSSPAEAVRGHLAFHEGPQWGKSRHLLVISWFRGDGRTALRYTVTETGDCFDVRCVFNWASQASHSKSLSNGELADLREIVGRLPDSKAEPPIERTVHVSFQADGKWRTVTYDSAALSPEFEKVLLIVGERFESAERHKKKER